MVVGKMQVLRLVVLIHSMQRSAVHSKGHCEYARYPLIITQSNIYNLLINLLPIPIRLIKTVDNPNIHSYTRSVLESI